MFGEEKSTTHLRLTGTAGDGQRSEPTQETVEEIKNGMTLVVGRVR
ncbi:hypothetical protein P5673_013287 [Acropora cervicornis]|uniref:Uncharacterized protein n=1 Tax=Acropora cervicornis TaxID=6130 RepID=A0AAD9QLP6_ACRCE|nr:hypothetical protein P5673_013287 [Acropora cervicornis]